MSELNPIYIFPRVALVASPESKKVIAYDATKNKLIPTEAGIAPVTLQDTKICGATVGVITCTAKKKVFAFSGIMQKWNTGFPGTSANGKLFSGGTIAGIIASNGETAYAYNSLNDQWIATDPITKNGNVPVNLNVLAGTHVVLVYSENYGVLFAMSSNSSKWERLDMTISSGTRLSATGCCILAATPEETNAYAFSTASGTWEKTEKGADDPAYPDYKSKYAAGSHVALIANPSTGNLHGFNAETGTWAEPKNIEMGKDDQIGASGNVAALVTDTYKGASLFGNFYTGYFWFNALTESGDKAMFGNTAGLTTA